MNIDLIAFARKVVGPGPDVARTVSSTPREIPGNWKMAGYAGIGLGVLSLGAGLATATDRTLGVFLTTLVYFMGVCQGAVMFAAIQTITLGRWGRPFKRVAESFAAMLPILYVLWIVFLLAGGIHIYPWTHEQMPAHKAIWLQPGFFIARQVVMLGVLYTMSLMYVRNSMRPDMGWFAEQIGSRAPAWWSNFTAGWKGRDAEVEDAYQRNIKLAPVMVPVYMVTYTLFYVDAVMSLNPHWYANMFPAWMSVSSLWVSLSWVVIVTVFSKKWLQIDHLVGRSNFHDIGKLMFALSVFWTYTFFSQLLPIWYGNMPEETGYLMLRLWAEPWAPLAKVVGAMCFLIPFTVLLSRGIKKIPESLVGVAFIIVTGVWLERFMLVMPEVWKEETLPLGLVEIGVFVGFIGLFFTVVLNVLSRVPPVVATDPFMNPNPADVHLHPAGAHGHGHEGGH